MADFRRPEQRSLLQRGLTMLASLGIQRSRVHSYHDVADSECEKFTDSGELEDPHRSRRRYFNINIWFFTTLLLLTFSVVQNMFRSQSEGSGSYETGFTTDFPDMQRTIQLEKHRFTAALRDHPNGTLYLVSDSSQRQYVGLPNTAIDNNWDALTHGRYVQLTAPETSLLHQDTQPTQTISFAPFGSTQRPAVYAGPDVLHSLHCLNAMRKHLDSTYYAASMDLPEEYRRMHMDHCIDQLRQSIMCHADLTPVTLKPVWEGGEEGPKKTVFYLGQTEREHTCRRWEDVRAWVDERGEGGKALDFH